MCVLVLFTNGVLLPMAQLWGVTVAPLAWSDMSVFALGLVATSISRTVEKLSGVTS